MLYVNDFCGHTDSERIEKAIDAAKASGETLVFTKRKADSDADRDWWLIDRAILLPADTTVVLQNCKIKLSDQCRDNFFRSANCGIGIEYPERIHNIHIRGEGLCILEGADYPRATGDSSKLQHNPCPHKPEDIIAIKADWVPEERLKSGNLDFWDIHNHSYGTDAGKPDESQYGDWRGIGVLFARVEDFSISGLRIVKSHGWGISLEDCANGAIEKIDFDACMYKEIDGMLMNMENQDGIDVRNGCHHILIQNITGQTGDDVIALTAIAEPNFVPGGSMRSTHVMHNDWTKREKDIHDIIIRNVIAHSYLCCTIRLLPAFTSIYNVVIDGVIDTAPSFTSSNCTLLLGEADGMWGKNTPDSMRNITISNIVCRSRDAVKLSGFITNSTFANIVNSNPDCPVIRVDRKGGMKNCAMSSLVSAGDVLVSMPD